MGTCPYLRLNHPKRHLERCLYLYLRRRAPKTLKWANFPRHELPHRNREPPARYIGGSADDEIDAAIHEKNRHQAFVVYYREPRTYAEAMASPEAKQWERALYEELNQLEETGTFKWIPENEVPPDHSPMGSTIVWCAKRDGEVVITKYKGCIVAQGFSQIPGR
jgi:hypothetical protein